MGGVLSVSEIPAEFKHPNYQRHPDPELQKYVLIPTLYQRVRALDGINYYVKQNNTWLKTEVFVMNSPGKQQYIKEQCYKKDGMCIYGKECMV